MRAVPSAFLPMPIPRYPSLSCDVLCLHSRSRSRPSPTPLRLPSPLAALYHHDAGLCSSELAYVPSCRSARPGPNRLPFFARDAGCLAISECTSVMVDGDVEVATEDVGADGEGERGCLSGRQHIASRDFGRHKWRGYSWPPPSAVSFVYMYTFLPASCPFPYPTYSLPSACMHGSSETRYDTITYDTIPDPPRWHVVRVSIYPFSITYFLTVFRPIVHLPHSI
ncbi:hypothetical protein C8F01DRAFT_1126832 [Mycena amicta]|nr:hypothetical protein C8F01DRAFT_1126832 [Mycena amicta]